MKYIPPGNLAQQFFSKCVFQEFHSKLLQEWKEKDMCVAHQGISTEKEDGKYNGALNERGNIDRKQNIHRKQDRKKVSDCKKS